MQRCAVRRIPPRAADFYASVKLSQQRRGLSIDENDLWIAPTTLALGATLVSSDGDLGRLSSGNWVLEAGEALGRGGIWIGVEGFHAPGGHGKSHDEIGVGDLGVVCIRVDMYRAVACLAAGFVT